MQRFKIEVLYGDGEPLVWETAYAGANAACALTDSLLDSTGYTQEDDGTTGRYRLTNVKTGEVTEFSTVLHVKTSLTITPG